MHIISDKSLARPGYVYGKSGSSWIGYPASIKPVVIWGHIDGPLLYMSNGELHWLTFFERMQLRLRWMTIEAIDRRRRRQNG